MNVRLAALVGLGLALAAGPAGAEPIFLARQYARCTTCHFSPTGGGLLTPYGRSLTREELSTMGRGHSSAPASGADGEQAFLYGVLGNRLGPLSLGIDLRPGHLDVRFPGGQDKRDLLMNAEITAAYRSKGWTVYGELGRQPLRAEGTRVDSFEHWVGFQSQKGFGFRAGRFLPAYGIHFSDHTAFNRKPLGLDTFDQVYGLELSHTTDRHLIQVTASPGRADSIIDNDGTRGFVGAARVQLDLSTRTVLVASGLFHDKSDLNPRDGSAGLALGFSPVRRLTIWTEGDAQFQQGLSGAPSYVLVNETGFEVYRGVWLKISPQLRTSFGDTSGGTFRWVFELNLLPRTHWNVDLSHYRDKGRSNDIVTKTTLLQLHLYL
jgi:hypothetical protein